MIFTFIVAVCLWLLKLCSDTFRQLCSVCWCHSGHFNQTIRSNVAFTHLHFESPCFACVYTSFTFVFHFCLMQPFFSVFHNSAFLRKSSLSRKPQRGFFQCSCRSHMCSVGDFASMVSYFLPDSVFTYWYYCLHFYLFFCSTSVTTFLPQCFLASGSLITHQLRG